VGRRGIDRSIAAASIIVARRFGFLSVSPSPHSAAQSLLGDDK
jgi:hypothetical protein